MATPNNVTKSNSSAGKDGLRLSVILIAAFFCMIGSFQYPLLGLLSMAQLFYAPFFVGKCVGIFRDKELDGIISFKKKFLYAFLTFMYSIIVLTFAQFIYFQFFDNGAFINQYAEIFNNPDYKEMFKELNITADVRKQFIEVLTSLRPIDLALQFMTTNLVIGSILSLIVAMFVRNKKNS